MFLSLFKEKMGAEGLSAASPPTKNRKKKSTTKEGCLKPNQPTPPKISGERII